MDVFNLERLPNGIRLVTAPVQQAVSTFCSIGIAVGSRYESLETRGHAHFVEHMLFTGTERRPSMRDLTTEVESIGAVQNASTAKEFTYYWIKTAAGQLPTSLEILVDMVRNSLFRDEDVERERSVITEEMIRTYQSPPDYVDELLEEIIYGDQPIGRPVIGVDETVDAAQRDALIDFAKRWYTPGRLVVSVAGAVEGARELVEELLGGYETADEPGPTPAAVTDGGDRVNLQTKDSEQAEVAVGVRAYPLEHPDRPVLDLIRTILGGGMSSRLTQRLVAEEGLSYSIALMLERYVDAGALWAQGGVNVDKVDRAVEVIVSELRRIAEEPVPAEELEKAHNLTKGRFAFQLETPQGLGGFGLRREVVEERLVEPHDVVAAVEAVTAEDVQRVATDLLEGGLYLAAIGPFDDPQRFERLIA